LAKRIQEITIEDKNLSEIVIELGYGAKISGTVTTENSREMPSSVNISAGDGENEEMTALATVYNGSESDTERGNPKPKKTNHDFELEGVAAGKTEFYISVSDDGFYVKSAMLNGTDLLAGPMVLKDGETLRNVQIVLSKGVGTIKGKITDGEKSLAKKVSFLLVPTNAVKRKNRSFYYWATSDENGEFEMKTAPGEYAIVFYGKEIVGKRGDELDRWIDEAIKEAIKVTVKANEIEKISLTAPK
jgi:hypothetical protein